MTDPFEPTPRSAQDQEKDEAEIQRLWTLVSLSVGNYATLPENMGRLREMTMAQRDKTMILVAIGYLVSNDIIAPGSAPEDVWFPVDIAEHVNPLKGK